MESSRGPYLFLGGDFFFALLFLGGGGGWWGCTVASTPVIVISISHVDPVRSVAVSFSTSSSITRCILPLYVIFITCCSILI
jgi:hypothetical protein